MKKVLFTTTALVASAGFAGMAAAQVSLSGSAEMGIFGGDIVDNSDNGFDGADPQFHTDIDVTFTMSGATDNGLTFGASVDLDESTGGGTFDNDTQGGESMFISGSFGTINAGDVDGGFQARLSDAADGPSTLNDDHTRHIGWSDNPGLDGRFDGQIVRYDYTFGGFTASASAEIDDDDTPGSDTIYGFGGSYSLSMQGVQWQFGAGYQTGTVVVQAGDDFADARVPVGTELDADMWGVSVSGSMNNGLSFTANYNDLDDAGLSQSDGGVGGNLAEDVWNISAGYTVGAISVGANYGQYDLVSGGEDEGYAINLGYDLGGGAEVEFGYGKSNPETGSDVDTYSFGVALSF